MKCRSKTLSAAKLFATALSALALIATTFTTSALAEANDTLDSLGTNSDNVSEVSSALEPSAADSLAASASANDEPIVIQGDTVIIQGDIKASDIYTAMQAVDPDEATTVLFRNQITITTDQNGRGPFEDLAWLQWVKADFGANVSFAPESGYTKINLDEFFRNATNLKSIDGLSTWKVTNVYTIYMMFEGCSSLTSLDALSSWDVSSLIGSRCMQAVFQGCSSLTSLDGISTWNVTNISGDRCMMSLFNRCSGLTSIDGLQNWNIANASAQEYGVSYMFSDCTALTSLTVNPTNGFQVTSDMKIPDAFSTGGNSWWPMKGLTTGCSTSQMITNSADTATYGNRWVRKDVDPYIRDVVPTVTWTTIAKPYTGLNQTIGPDTVEVNGVELTPGVDYAVYYTKENTRVQEDANVLGDNPLQIDDGAYPVVREEGAYAAKLYLQGKYIGKEDPSYTQTVYVGDAPVTTVELTFSAREGIFASTGTNTLTLSDLTPGEELSSVETPTLAGYTFAGWENEAGNPVSFPLTIPDANATYTATWSSEPGPGPTPPGPEPTPASDGTLIPSTGDTTSMPTAALILSAAALLGMVAIACTLNMRALKHRK